MGTTSRAIPPESPLFVDVPRSFQPDLRRRPIQKGYLPTPKQIFPRSRPEKLTSEYALAATPLPKNPVDLNDPSLSEHARYKARMADLRRSHLRSGLSELQVRKTSLDKRTQLRSQMKRAESERLVHQAPREDERLTNASIPASMSPDIKHHFSPAEALALHEQKMQNVARAASQKVAERTDQLHTLYVNAKNFITSEEQLLEAVKREFAPDRFGHNNKSMWDKRSDTGAHNQRFSKVGPEGIQDMLLGQGVSGGTTEPRGALRDALARNDAERMKKIGEKLSGGKI